MSAKAPDTHLQEFIGVLLLALGLLLLISLLSYDPQDPSLTSVSSLPVVHNLTGRVGAILADGLFQLIGGGAYLLSVGALLLGWRSLLHRASRLTPKRVLGYGLLFLLIPTLFDLWFWALPSPTAGWILQGRAGGVGGTLLHSLLAGYFNPVGAHIVTLAGLVSALMLVSSFSPLTLAMVSSKALRTLAATLA